MEQHLSLYKVLVSLEGQTLKWVGFDENEERFVLLFEDGQALSLPVSEIVHIADPSHLLRSLTQENGLQAEQILKLKGMAVEHAYAHGVSCGFNDMVADEREFGSPEELSEYKRGYEDGKAKRIQEAVVQSAGVAPVSPGASGT